MIEFIYDSRLFEIEPPLLALAVAANNPPGVDLFTPIVRTQGALALSSGLSFCDKRGAALHSALIFKGDGVAASGNSARTELQHRA